MLLKKIVVYYVVGQEETSTEYTAKDDNYLTVYNRDDGRLVVNIVKEVKGKSKGVMVETIAVYSSWLNWQSLEIIGDFNYKQKYSKDSK